jgi:uncharacterized protein with HEPN domain
VRSDRDRLADILEAIGRIRERLPPAQEEFQASDLLQVWVVHHLQVIGEAANHLSPAFIDSHQEIPWRRIIGLRHALVHQYFGVDLDAVWSIAVDDLPPLETAVAAILAGSG